MQNANGNYVSPCQNASDRLFRFARQISTIASAVMLTSAIVGFSLVLPDTMSTPAYSLVASDHIIVSGGLVYELA